MKVLVTGSSGQLGAEIARQLLRAGATVIGLDRVAGERTLLLGSIEDRELVADAISGVDAVIHTASLHAPHVPTFTRQQFVDVNVSGTLNLLEAAARTGVRQFIYTSTTSVYGYALVPTDRAVWVTEALTPQPRDIYDVTKLAAENLCRLFADRLAVLVLRTSRFYEQEPRLMAWYRLYRGGDVRDIARAHLLALDDPDDRFEILNVSGPTPFREEDTPALLVDPAAVIRERAPGFLEAFTARGWAVPESVDRVYRSDRAEARLGYRPRHDALELVSRRAM